MTNLQAEFNAMIAKVPYSVFVTSNKYFRVNGELVQRVTYNA